MKAKKKREIDGDISKENAELKMTLDNLKQKI